MIVVSLSLADLWHERRMFVCHALALAAVLAPLLVLYGLKSGVIDTLTEQLLDDPRNRELIVVGNRAYSPEWLQILAQQPDAGFLIARTRSIAASLNVARADGRGGTVDVELVPSAQGDPLLAGREAPRDDRVLASQALAQQIGLAVGDRLAANVVRDVASGRERQVLDLTVAAILPAEAYPRRALFVGLPLLEAVEHFRDGYAVPAHGWPGEEAPERPRSYASFRLYAASLDGVAVLADYLVQQGVEVRTRATEIAQVRALDRNLSRIFGILVGLGGGGYLLSLGATLWAQVERKRRTLSLLHLVGVPGRALAGFPAVQAVGTALAGAALASLFALAAALFVNALFPPDMLGRGDVCRLRPEDLAVAAAVTVVTSVAAALAAGWKAARLEPAEGIRDA